MISAVLQLLLSTNLVISRSNVVNLNLDYYYYYYVGLLDQLGQAINPAGELVKAGCLSVREPFICLC
jgi:hypothetical protein